MKSIFATAMLMLSGAVAAATPLPADSVLQLSNRFTDQDGKSFVLSERRGHVQVVSMFYSSCKFVCPLLIDSGLGLDKALAPAERARLRVLLISLDPVRDTTAALNALATKRKLDRTRWTLARTDKDGVRKMAALLDVRYRQLADGEFNHTSGLILLDSEGRILARTEKLGATPDPAFLAAVRKALKASK